MDLLEQMDWFFAMKNHERDLFICKEEKQDCPSCAAEITMNERYSRISIRLYPPFWEQPLENQRETLLHEMCHTLILPVQHEATELLDGKLRTSDQVAYAVENSTSRVTIIIDALLCNGRKFMRDAYRKYTLGSNIKKTNKKKTMASKKSAAKSAPKKAVASAKKSMKKGMC